MEQLHLMAEKVVTFRNQYMSILRCRTWCNWPEQIRAISKAFLIPPETEEYENIYLSIHLVSYEQRPRPEILPAKLSERSNSPILWRGKMDTGYWVGQYLIKAPEDVIKIEFEHQHALQGEIDIQLHIGSQIEVSRDKLREIATSVSFSVLSYLNVRLKDFLVPVAPIQVSEVDEVGRHFENPATVRVRERNTFDYEILQAKLDEYVRERSPMSEEESKALDVATRRYLNSLIEEDVIDKYCDLWEVCEFATLDIKATGKKVGRIARALAIHMLNVPIEVGKTAKADEGTKKLKTKLESDLRLTKLYGIRNDIVHNAVENPGELQQFTEILESIAHELIRFRLGGPYEGNKIIEETLNSAGDLNQ